MSIISSNSNNIIKVLDNILEGFNNSDIFDIIDNPYSKLISQPYYNFGFIQTYVIPILGNIVNTFIEIF